MKKRKFTKIFQLGLLCWLLVSSGLLSAQISETSSPALATADNSVVTDMITVAGIPASTITSITIDLDMDHTFPADLEIAVESPDGSILMLTADLGGGTDWTAGNPVTFTDLAVGPFATPPTAGDMFVASAGGGTIGQAPAPTVGTFAGMIAAIGDGTNANGDWILHVGDDAGGDGGTVASWTVNIDFAVDNGGGGGGPVPCALVCPDDQFINLAGGECDPIYNYTIGQEGDCPQFGDLMNTIAVIDAVANDGSFEGQTWTSTSTNFGTAYCTVGLCGTGAGSINYGVAPNDGTVLLWFGGALSPEVGTATTTVEIAEAFEGTATMTFAFENSVCGNAADDVVLQIDGNTVWSYTTDPNACDANGTITDIVVDVTDYADGGMHTILFTGTQTTGAVTNFTVDNVRLIVEQLITADDITQTEGLPSGSNFPSGVTTNTFVATGDGETFTCTFNVTVTPPVANTSLACNDNVQVSVDDNCMAMVGADEILEGGPYACYDTYIVEIAGIAGNVNGMSTTLPSGTHTVTVTDPNTNNSCWGTILVEDKLPPMIECLDAAIFCGESTDPVFGATPTPIGTSETVVSGADILSNEPAAVSTIDVSAPAGVPVSDVNVGVDITHTWTGDLTVTLTSPAGTNVILFQDCGNDDNLVATFDDAAAAGVDCANTDAGQTITPTESLAVLNGEDIGGTWTLTVDDQTGGDNGTLNAWTLFASSEFIDAPNAPAVSDNCDSNPDLTYTDSESGDECSDLAIVRTWVATDESGNTASCTQTILVAPLNLDVIEFPETYEGECGESSDPSNTGWPTVNGSVITPGGDVCNIFVEYWDKPFTDCGAGTKIQRTWTILDWCNQETVTGIQLIKLADNEGPAINCPDEIEVNTDFWYCYANVSLPPVTAVDACGGAVTYSVTSDAGQVQSVGSYFVINQLPIGTYTATYVATDACDNSSSCEVEITVADNVPPVPNCDEHTIVSLTNDGPYGVTLIPATVFDDGSYDNCTDVTFRARRMDHCIDFDWTTDGACIDDQPNNFVDSRDRGRVLRECIPVSCCDVGADEPIMVELEVKDASGNVNFCMVEVEVQDKLAPFLVPPPNIIVSCDFWFDDSNIAPGFVPAEEAALGVFGTVLDAYEYNDDESARQYIRINDPGAPGPQPKTWGRDGWADDNCDVEITVQTVILDDCSGDDLPSSAPDNAVRCIERRWKATDGQNNSTTLRQRIYVVDYDRFDENDITWPWDLPRGSACDFDECPTGEMTPDNLAALGFTTRCVRPQVNDDNCSLIGITYDDTRFDFVDGACFKILREWTIIDWCQYDANTGAGIWKHTQVIKVIDENGPEFQDCPAGPVTLCVEDEGVELASTNQVFLGEGGFDAQGNPATACRVHVDLSHVVAETCSDEVIYDVKIYPFNGSNFIYLQAEKRVTVGDDGTVELTASSKQASSLMVRRDGLPYNSKWCGDYHRVLWTVEDGCGNSNTCEYLVRLEDCKKPSPVCINGISTVVMPVGGTVTIWAKEFNVSSIDDCTPSQDLLYSFSGSSYQPSKEYSCDNVPAFGAELSEQVWVADGGVDHNCNNQISWSERNTDFCTTTIVITDNEDVCGGSGALTVAGEINTQQDVDVENATMTLTSPTSVFPTVVTPDNGVYSFIAPLGNDYTIDAERNDDHKNGVSTLDLVRIQKHLLGVQPFDNPYDLIAADANNNQGVSALDLVELRKLILGIYTELPNSESWRFVDQGFEFANPASPWPFDETVNITNLSAAMMDNDFVAVKVGDVNNTVVANATQVVTRSLNGVFNMITDDRNVVAGETVNVTFSAESFNTLVGFQFTMNAKGLELNDVKGAATDVSSENIGIVDGQITASWNKVKGAKVSADDAIFTFEFVATQNGTLSQMLSINSDITEAEAYNKAEDIMNVGLVFRGAEGSDFSLYQNEPNPFDGKTIVGFDLPEAGTATLTVFDVTGKVITVIDGDYAKGFNRVELNSKDLSATGVMYYRLDAGEYTATKKMVVIK